MGLVFDGLTTRVDCGSAASIDNIWAGGGTFCAWVNLSGYGEAAFGRIADKSDSTALTTGWAIYISGNGDANNDNCLRLGHGRATGQNLWTSPTNSILLDTVYHVAVTYSKDDTGNVPVLYINGISQTISTASTGTGALDDDSAQTLSIGNRSAAADRSFDGAIGDARFYTRILTGNEIQTIHACRGHDGIVDNLVARWMMNELSPGTAATVASSIIDISGQGNHGTPVGSPAYSGSILSNLNFRRRVNKLTIS